MPAAVSDDELGRAVLQAAQDGVYPDSEDVISAELPASAFGLAVELLEKAREEVKSNIRGLSRKSAGDVDTWISQAKSLHADIEEAKATARAIIVDSRGDSGGGGAQTTVEDAESKQELLDRELVFNRSLEDALELIQSVDGTLASAQDAAVADRLGDAANDLCRAEEALDAASILQSTAAFTLLTDRTVAVRDDLTDRLEKYWSALIVVDRRQRSVTIRDKTGESPSIHINTVVSALDKLMVLKSKTDKLFQALDDVIFAPRLSVSSGATPLTPNVSHDTLQLLEEKIDNGVTPTLSDVRMMVDFLSSKLPASILSPLSSILMPSIVSKLIAGWLNTNVPSTLEGLHAFHSVLSDSLEFRDAVASQGWYGTGEITEWARNAPQVWRLKRREAALNEVRTVLAKGFGQTRTVERVETQTIGRDDTVFASNKDDEWNQEWSDEEEGKSDKKDVVVSRGQDEEEDVSAWGLDEEEPEDGGKRDQSHGEDDSVDVDEEAWGWGEDNQEPTTPAQLSSTSKRQTTNGEPTKGSNEEREMTLRETYTITSIPESIVEIVLHIVQDAGTLSGPSYSRSPVAPAAAGLFSIPTHALAMLRALGPFYYAKHASGNMYLYNDSLRLAERLRTIQTERTEKSTASSPNKLKLDSDIQALESLGKRAFSKEMESQRTILGDLLDGAQGFNDCTVPPFASECETAIESVVDRIQDVAKEWKGVLSQSALLQAIGSLLSTVTNKIIVDIEDMGDISEAESQKISAFCNRIASLETLFLPEGSSQSQESVPLTAVYVPSWLKFQYLGSILESSLVDIKYLWTEGELKLEFSAEEVIDLIEALFADSEHRRRAIGEIRRNSIVR
ncbi:MAG: hypothetical protein M1833_001767 [Piccolia ochrophora]|nr:MAG: hypothetical protein M1833_001767 [Piccolia ochrophora]